MEPGPVDDTLLTRQHTHRSQDVWVGQVSNMNQTSIEATVIFWQQLIYKTT